MLALSKGSKQNSNKSVLQHTISTSCAQVSIASLSIMGSKGTIILHFSGYLFYITLSGQTKAEVVPVPPLEKADIEHLLQQTPYNEAEIKSWHK